jgi:hypothetical protein
MCAREEVDFAEEAQTWGGICISEKFARAMGTGLFLHPGLKG